MKYKKKRLAELSKICVENGYDDFTKEKSESNSTKLFAKIFPSAHLDLKKQGSLDRAMVAKNFKSR